MRSQRCRQVTRNIIQACEKTSQLICYFYNITLNYTKGSFLDDALNAPVHSRHGPPDAIFLGFAGYYYSVLTS